jgi:acyl dehydratase
VSRKDERMSPAAFGFWSCTHGWIVLSLVLLLFVAIWTLPSYEVRWNPYVAVLYGVVAATLLAPVTFGAAVAVGLACWVWAAFCTRRDR